MQEPGLRETKGPRLPTTSSQRVNGLTAEDLVGSCDATLFSGLELLRVSDELTDVQKQFRVVLYDIDMLCGCKELWGIAQQDPLRVNRREDEVLRNALLESFLIHARCLADLVSGKGDSRDLQVEEFVNEEFSKSGARASGCSFYSKYKTRINKWLAHQDPSRAQHLNLQWDIPKMAGELMSFLEPLLENVNDEIRDAYDVDRARSWLEILKP